MLLVDDKSSMAKNETCACNEQSENVSFTSNINCHEPVSKTVVAFAPCNEPARTPLTETITVDGNEALAPPMHARSVRWTNYTSKTAARRTECVRFDTTHYDYEDEEFTISTKNSFLHMTSLSSTDTSSARRSSFPNIKYGSANEDSYKDSDEDSDSESYASTTSSKEEWWQMDAKSNDGNIFNVSCEKKRVPTMSAGSHNHGTRDCEPCAFWYTVNGCTRGEECVFCHLCPRGEFKRKKKARIVVAKAARKLQLELEDAEQCNSTRNDARAGVGSCNCGTTGNAARSTKGANTQPNFLLMTALGFGM